jgi:hypothetical protein
MVLEKTIVAGTSRPALGYRTAVAALDSAVFADRGRRLRIRLVFENRIGTPGVPVTPLFGAIGL